MIYAWIENNNIFATEDINVIPKNVNYVEFENLTITDANKLKLDSNGNIVVKSDTEILNELKQQKLTQLASATTAYIESYYPDIKQKSDILDKEFYSSMLLAMNSNYSTSTIYKDVYQSAVNILTNKSTLQNEVSKYPSQEKIAWEQLIKVALRVAFVNKVKQEYYQLAQAIQNATTKEELDNIQIEFKTEFPL